MIRRTVRHGGFGTRRHLGQGTAKPRCLARLQRRHLRSDGTTLVCKGRVPPDGRHQERDIDGDAAFDAASGRSQRRFRVEIGYCSGSSLGGISLELDWRVHEGSDHENLGGRDGGGVLERRHSGPSA